MFRPHAILCLVLLPALALLVFAEAAVAACHGFETDPGLQSYANVDGSRTFFYTLPGMITVQDGNNISVSFRVTESMRDYWGHTTVLGPRSSVPDAWPTLQLNLYYGRDSAAPPGYYELSMAGGGLPFPHYTAQLGLTYHAYFVRAGNSVVFELYREDPGPTYVRVFQDLWVGYTWPAFDAFQVCYDYYTGSQGFCQWNPGSIEFLSDRDSWFVHGFIDRICVDEPVEHPVPTETASWGRIKTLFKD
jgi:hypothetical protein